MRERLHHLLPALAGGAALTVGFLASALWSSEAVRSSVESISELETIGLEPVRALPRTDDFLAMVEARANLADGRPWNAWRVLREHVAEPAEAPPALALLAAEAAAGWGAWEEVERVLDGRGWLDGEDDGAGWLLLGRALEELQRPGEAVRAYQRQVRLANGRERGVGYARLGRLLGARGEWSPAAGAY
ncbi:MAG: hypothetical protein ACREKN_09485, partial [Longimicrobiaceae bacterium]